MPGPGQYSLPTSIQTGPTFTIAQRLHAPDPAPEAPGPGTYHQSQSFLQSGPAFTLAARQPAFTAQSSAPGPGTYDTAGQGKYVTFRTLQLHRRVHGIIRSFTTDALPASELRWEGKSHNLTAIAPMCSADQPLPAVPDERRNERIRWKWKQRHTEHAGSRCLCVH